MSKSNIPSYLYKGAPDAAVFKKREQDLSAGISNGSRHLSKESIEKVRRRSTTLFTAASVITVTIIGLLIGLRIAATVEQQMIESYVLSNANQVSAVVNANLTADDLKSPFSGDRYDNFHKFVNKSIAGTAVVRVKLWRPDGTILYSNDRKLVGKRFDGQSDLARAAKGHLEYKITDLKADDNYSERSKFNRLLEIYYPVKMGKTGKVSAVYEYYLSVLPLEQYVSSVMRSLAIGLAAMVLVLVIFAQIASRMLRRRNDRLSEMTANLEVRADTDGLTGLYNHRHFQSFFEREISVAQRYKRDVSILMIDLDFFKNVNDRYGHQIGDSVLKRISMIFPQVLRDVDYAARYGGEEFVVVLPETGAVGAMAIADRLRSAVSEIWFDVGGSREPLKVTLSCGVADFPACADDPKSLIAAADSALLFAKQQGRNKVCYFREITRRELNEGDIEKLVSRLQNASLSTLQALATAVNERDAHGSRHSINLSSMATVFGRKLGMAENILHAFRLAAQVHDISKITISERTLCKTEALTESEMEAIRAHPEVSYKIVKTAAQTGAMLTAILHHHESWDGTGYPNGLKGKEIPFMARALHILDSYGAMISDRPYRKAMSPEEACAELRAKAGSQFDPQLVEDFITGVNVPAKSDSKIGFDLAFNEDLASA